MEAPNVIVVSRSAEGWQAVVAGRGLVRARSLQALDRRIQAHVEGKPVSLTCCEAPGQGWELSGLRGFGVGSGACLSGPPAWS